MQSTHYVLDESSESYSIKEWSDSLKAEEVVATFTFDTRSVLHIQASEGYAAKLLKLGIRSAGNNKFQIDMLEAPPEVIAAALGLPGQSPEFRAECARRFEGYVSGANMLAIAFEGHPMQSGRVDMGGPANQMVVMNMAQLVPLDGVLKSIPSLPGFLGASHDHHPDLLVKSAVCIKDNALLPGYIMTAKSGASIESATDRIAITVAYLEQVAKIPGTKGDRLLKIGVLDDGRPFAVFSDSTRNPAQVISKGISKRDPGCTMVYANFTDLRAKRGVSLSVSEAGADMNAFSTYYQVSALRQIVEERVGTMPSTTAFIGSQRLAHGVAPKLASHASIESLAASRDVYSRHAESSLKIAKAHARADLQGGDHLIETVKGHLSAVARLACNVKDELNGKVQKQKELKNKPDRFYSNTVLLEP